MDAASPRFELRYLVGGMACIRLVAAFEQRLAHSGGSRVQSLLLASDEAWHEGASAAPREGRIDLDEPAGGSPRWFAAVRHGLGRRASRHEAELSEREAHGAVRGEAGGEPGTDAERTLSELRALSKWEGHSPRCVLSRERQSFRDRGGDLEVVVESRLRCRGTRLPPRPGESDAGSAVLAPGEHLVEIRVRRVVPYWLAVLLRRLDGVRRAPSDRELALAALACDSRAATAT